MDAVQHNHSKSMRLDPLICNLGCLFLWITLLVQLWTTTSTAQDLESKTEHIIEAVTKSSVQDMFSLLDALAQLCMMSTAPV